LLRAEAAAPVPSNPDVKIFTFVFDPYAIFPLLAIRVVL
jgi:hypothetical protein